MFTYKKNERGQAIVIIAVVFIVLLGFAGLAIDAGMVYSDRRNAQNAADASSLAGAARIDAVAGVARRGGSARRRGRSRHRGGRRGNAA